MPKERVVYLPPGHSSWWLIDPGVTLFFEKVIITRGDYEDIQSKKDKSTFNKDVAIKFEQLMNLTDIEIIDTIPGLQNRKGDDINYFEHFMSTALSSSDPSISADDILTILIDAYDYWIQYNGKKLSYLLDDEQLAVDIRSELIPGWQSRKCFISELLPLDSQTEKLMRLKSDTTATKVFNVLIDKAKMYMEMVDLGLHIYDPLLEEYMPLISFLEHLRTDNISTNEHTGEMLQARQITTRQRNQIPPRKIPFRDLGKIIKEYKEIRKLLLHLDQEIRAINEKDPATAFDKARLELSRITKEIKRASEVMSVAVWLASFFQLAAIILNPKTVTKMKKLVEIFTLIQKKVGRFAGTYSLIAEDMITTQRHRHGISKFDTSYVHYKESCWDSGE